MSQEGEQNYTSKITPEGELPVSDYQKKLFNNLQLHDRVTVHLEDGSLVENCIIISKSKDESYKLVVQKYVTAKDQAYQAGPIYHLTIRGVVDSPYNIKDEDK
jgi:hypothetical protein